MSAKRKRRDRSPSLSSDSKENIDFDEEDNPDRANDSDDSLDMEISSIGETSFLNSQDKSNYIECGTIKSLKLVNFMCHGHFAIEFGPRINFVIGRNGSGKSAILTAIVLALGGRSHHTSRGQSLKSFIKTGESRAKIVIKLNNFNNIDKSASFKYEEYGDTIWIERLLKSDGSSTYNLKNKNGKSITTMKKELDTIVKHFNIQIDNPIVVLNQEISRNFLNSKNPRDKYSFFMKATQLEDILNDYAYASEKTSLTELELDKKKKILKDVASELKDLKKKVALFAKIDDQNNKLGSLDKELLWALVCEKEREFEEILSKIEENNGKVIEHTTTINKLENKLTKFSADKENTQKDLDDMAIKVDEIKAKIGEKTQILTEYKEKKNNLFIECSRLKNELDAMGKDEKHLERKINELKKQFGDVEKVEEERHLRAEMVAKLEEEERQLKAEIRTRKLHKEQLQGSISEIEKKIYGCKAEIDSIKSSIYRKKQDIQQARSSENDQLLRFGVYMPHLLKQIDLEFKQGRFVKKPLGPIGHLIKLRDPGAAFAVECCIKGLVTAFCCDNQGDANVLSQLFKRTLGNARPPMIITRRFTNLHNVSSNCIQSDKYKSILELLDIDLPPVANVLIDRSNIESIAYIANEDEALNVMTNAEKVPHNCNQAYTKQGTNMYPVKRNQFFKSYAPNYNQAKYLTHDISDYILSLEHELVELNKKWESRTADLTPLQENLQENKLDLAETTNKLSKLYDRANEVSRELEELKNVVETTPVEMDLFEKDLSDLRMEKTTRNEKLAGLQEKYSEIKTLIEEINVKITTLQDEKTRLCHEERPAREKMKTLEDQLVSVQRTLNRFKDNLSSVEEEIHELKKAQESKKQEVENMRQKAMEETGQEIRTNRSPSDVKKEIVDIKRFMQEQESEIGDRDKIIKQYNDRIEAHERVLEQVETFEELLEEFKTSTKMRLDKYRRLRKQITEKACQVFKIALDALNFSGILEINHDDCIIDGASKKAKTLDIKINPKVMVNSDVYKDTRSLSGGERSYGTVAFLVALWESCNSPFRILDEVDVFMDVVTRSTAMQILVENAKLKHGKQYIFLSPLGLVVDEKYVHVHRMPDPVRGISNGLSHTD